MPSIIDAIKTAPQTPGVYLFYADNTLLYVGKAVNLRARLKSYLRADDPKTQSLHEETSHLEVRELRSDIEALITESRLIKELKPKYNVLWRDDKSYLYVYFNADAFPKVFVGHEKPSKRIMNKELRIMKRIGPFTESATLRSAMKLIRRSIPYCSCMRPHKRACLNAQIGLCMGVCCVEASSSTTSSSRALTRDLSRSVKIPVSTGMTKYVNNITKIKNILRGKYKAVHEVKDVNERAVLEKIFEHREFLNPSWKLELGNWILPSRVECFDISHLTGKETVGAMTVLIKKDGAWTSDKNSYRKFIIKNAPKHDDPRAIAEVIERRMNHPEWPYADLMIIDGGIGQLRAARVKRDEGKRKSITMISFAKPKQLVYGLKANDEPTPLKELPKEFQKLIMQAIHQTHDFVIRFHRQKRRKNFLL